MSGNSCDKLLDLYVESGRLYATSLVAVIFGQFSVLTLLQGKGCSLICPRTNVWSVSVMIFVYAAIVGVGSIIVYYYLIFACLLEHLKSKHFPNVKRLDKRMRREVGEWKPLPDLRTWIIQRRHAIVVIYVITSFGALAATLCMR